MLWFPRSPGNFFKLPLHCLSLTLSSNSYSSEFNSFRHFQKTINYYSLSQFRQKYGELKPGEKLMEIPIQIAGRIITKRTAGRNLIFYDLAQDCNNLQVVANSKRFETLNTFDNINKIARNNCVIEVIGFPGKTKTGELSLFSTKIKVLAVCDHPIPKQLLNKTLRYKNRCLDMLVSSKFSNILRVRSKIIREIRKYFDENNFVEVETPVLSHTATGALAKPFVTKFSSSDRKLFLRIAPEIFLKTLVIGGLERVYEIGKQFRNEGFSHRHYPEFTSIEFYEAYADMKGLVARTEALFRHVVRAVKGALAVEITPKVSSAEEPHARKAVILDFSKPFARVHVLKAIFKKTGLSVDVFDKNLEITLRTLCTRQSIAFKASDSRIQLFDGLVSSLIEPSCVQPTFLVGFPSFMSPLACDSPSEPGISERFEFFVNGMELCNAYTELGDPMKQRQKFMEYEELQNRESSNHVAMNEEFCKALEYGLPPTVGWGMGIDRLTMLLTNSSSIREVISFPTLDYESLGYQQKQQ